ncbi:hypothetical protein [Treponema endosymbiont of Eucomonympha sp.]|uniref:hypothetical protein n=1 Tax=Treponema endosymbiont of Eucomonympha sp. TaxID=1580831 RepID=UPI001E3991F2|nr:hypothetical protein [Treponema endosymbiont of Eucomonympha sp.]
MALVFLVLLYNSPAGLVLYWTVNNVFSLAKIYCKRQSIHGGYKKQPIGYPVSLFSCLIYICCFFVPVCF